MALIDRQADAAREAWVASTSMNPWIAVARAVLATKAQTPREQLLELVERDDVNVYGVSLRAALLDEDAPPC
jgi:hypothetical protein